MGCAHGASRGTRMVEGVAAAQGGPAIAKDKLARLLAHAFLSAEWTLRDLEGSGRKALGLSENSASNPRLRGVHLHLRRLVFDMLKSVETLYPPDPATLCELIAWSTAYEPLAAALGPSPELAESVEPPRFAPIPAFEELDLPRLRTPRELANWLALDMRELEWFADPGDRLAAESSEKLRHYVCIRMPKPSGGARLIEAPKPRLKAIHRRILREILDPVPPHDAAHGFRAGRCCQTGAQRHAGEEMVLTLDLENFFPSVAARRVHATFRCLGYPWAVARYLTGLCATVTPQNALPVGERKAAARQTELFTRPHLPQGAPTSPALANLAAWRLDLRLTGLARRFEATYTRYADDLAFSGDAGIARGAMMAAAEQIIRDEGFTPHPTKRRIMPKSVRQTVTGLVVNEGLNIRRDAFDALKATLHNCARHGPASQNHARHPDFRAHLEGRVAWIESVNYNRGRKLRALFDQINWP